MPKIMLVNVTHVEESRVAVLEDGVLATYEIETTNRTSLKGNIYNAVVESVHASLEAAFVKLGPDLKGFLPLDMVNFRLLPARSDDRKGGKIGQHLHQGQKLMAQVVREPFAGKPPTVSTYFSLPGRHLVLMPGVDAAGISRKIENAEQRERLRKVIDELPVPEGFGLIVRTAGMGQTKTELHRDLRYLLRLWESIQRASGSTDFPGLVYREADLVIRTIRDHLSPDIGEVWIDSNETFEKALEFVRDVMPKRAKTIRIYTGERPLFNKYNLEEQIERIYKRCVPLPSGGEIVIDGTEALTAIDVNSARTKRQGDIEDNILQTNLEAAAEIGRQLRLRDLGGLIVIDFIDMLATRNKKNVEKTMREALRGDKARYDLTPISKLGLMELARQRIKGTKMAASYATCAVCDGHGLVKNVESAALSALRKLQTRSARGGFGTLRVGLPSEVAAWLSNFKREELLRLEQRHQITIEIEPRASLLRHETTFETVARDRRDEATSKTAGETAATPPAPAAAREPTRPKASAEPARVAAEREAPPAVARIPEARSEPRPQETKGEQASVASDAATESGDDKPRRRRRKKRRGRSGGGPAPDSKTESRIGDGESRPKQGTGREPMVPRGIRSDELMPAASGSAAGSRRKRGSENPVKSTRKKSSSRGSRRSRTKSKADAGAGGSPVGVTED
jgi:ribonuclease E